MRAWLPACGARLRGLSPWWLLAVLGGVPTGLFIATSLDRVPPVIVLAGIPATPIIGLDQQFHGEWKVNVLRNCPGHFRRWIESTDSDWFVWLPSFDTDFGDKVPEPPKLVLYPVTPFDIPLDAPSGPASYHAVGIFRCNSLGHVLFPLTVTYPPMSFTIDRARGAP